MLGKVATWMLYARIGFTIVTDRRHRLAASWLFWIGLGARGRSRGRAYARKAREEMTA